ncbi:hypothetical protein HanXRQr2_Chr08g0357111 [Helianthus annuus]|uniref:Uncharacterized protein n=1 Tax=Helianthus annuus TaxID=4232 RepID=A0A9K3II22_HELAN|nr:hypothetical protein HanXRQr2_Chr08g0357111 [Helianthus annuus]KAJ0903073.1 hypothetical protein HanPSC8_Chr08g0344801 [Helianthus annuus]
MMQNLFGDQSINQSEEEEVVESEHESNRQPDYASKKFLFSQLREMIKHQKRKQYALFFFDIMSINNSRFFNTPFSLLTKYFLELKHKASGGSLKRH